VNTQDQTKLYHDAAIRADNRGENVKAILLRNAAYQIEFGTLPRRLDGISSYKHESTIIKAQGGQS
jgi:hypothetical protein